MTHTKFSLEDFNDDASFARAVSKQQKGQITLKGTTGSLSPDGPNLNMTTLGLSDVMQGRALWSPIESVNARQYQLIANDLSGLLKAEGKKPEEVIGKGSQFLPYDLMLKKSYADPYYSGIAGSGGPGGGSGSSAVPGITVEGADGVRFVSEDNLKPHVVAARQFIKENFPTEYGIGGYASSGHTSNSDHYKGLALDVMVCKGGNRAEGAERDKGDQIANWFCANPDVFKITYIIWMDRIISRSKKDQGWRQYTHSSGGGGNTVQHRDHVHISFDDIQQTTLGPMGNSWLGSS